ncbi:hypothetical protein COO60DRAFT_1270164 [Scenedesmus sp. NREL 46B-D3]|nr:hypothetical protein COO60DRAFT_1270164 [Scenedesmus sp. NREL 46B-D3]
MLKNLTLPELEEWCTAVGEDARRARQLWRWLYYDGNWVASLQDTLGRQNGCSQRFVAKAGQLASVDGGLLLEQVAAAKDGTTKLVFKLTEGEGAGGSVEAVLIPMLHRRGARKHVTLCVSSQVGCAMNCQFCYTGRMGLSGNLSTAQIIEQVRQAAQAEYGIMLWQAGQRRGTDASADASITNVVFMGMGEPLHNYEAVMAAVDILCQPLGLHMSHNKVTVSTVGLVDVLERFAASSNVQLALSLHATTDEVRDWIVPVNRRHNLAALSAVLRQQYGAGNAAGRRVLVEYTMLSGVNDTLQDAQRLVQLLEGVEAKVNLITFNPFQGTRFRPSSIEQVLAFRSVLIQAGRICTIRDSRGDDEMAACGQLGNPALSSKAAPILPPPPQFEHVLCNDAWHAVDMMSCCPAAGSAGVKEGGRPYGCATHATGANLQCATKHQVTESAVS